MQGREQEYHSKPSTGFNLLDKGIYDSETPFGHSKQVQLRKEAQQSGIRSSIRITVACLSLKKELNYHVCFNEWEIWSLILGDEGVRGVSVVALTD